MFCMNVCLRSQFVASPRCQHILKRVITRPEYTEQKTRTSEEKTSSEWNFTAFLRYLWYGPRGDKVNSVVWFLIQLIFWVAVVHPITIMPIGLMVYLCLYVKWYFSLGPTPKGWQQEVLDKFEHPYYKFLNHTLFYVAFLCLVFASAFENEFDYTTFLGLSNLRELVYGLQGVHLRGSCIFFQEQTIFTFNAGFISKGVYFETSRLHLRSGYFSGRLL